MFNQDVDARVDAYRGNPEALKQKYAVSQELVDLLALQKIKSEMDAKSRQMQLTMAQQGKKPTIKDKIEQEVVGRTKQEMQQQLAGTMQQQAEEKQKALQQVVEGQTQQGVASLPAPGMMPVKAMAAGGILDFSAGGPNDTSNGAPISHTPQEYETNMASGGIVAFANGGSTWDKKKTPYDELIEREARRRGIDPVVFKRLIGSESSFNESAVSPRGERYGLGIAQIADVHGMSKEDRLNPNKAIPAAAEIFSKYLERAGGDYAKALQMYKGASTEGGKRRMAGPIQRILEGVTDTLIPSARAEEVQTRGVGQPTKKAVAPAEEEAAYDPMTGIRIAGPEATPYKPKAREENRLPPGTEYDPITEGIGSGIGHATGAVREFLQGRPEAGIETPSAGEPRAKTTGQFGGYNIPEDQFPIQGTQEMLARGQIGVGSAEDREAPPSIPPAPNIAPTPAPAKAGITSIMPPEYAQLAGQHAQYLSKQFDRDPEAERRTREAEYRKRIGVPTEQAIAEKSQRLAGLEALDAKRAARERELELTDALLGARGASWQQALGSAGRAGIESERRNAEALRKRLIEANMAKDVLADVGLRSKSDIYGAGLGALKEAEGALKDASTESGLTVGRGLAAETQRLISDATIRSAEMLKEAQMAAAKATSEADLTIKVQQARASDLARNITPLRLAYEKAKDNINLMSGNKPSPEQLRELEIMRKEIQLAEQTTNDKYDALLFGKGGSMANWGELRVKPK